MLSRRKNKMGSMFIFFLILTGFLFVTQVFAQDDPYEENDTFETAYEVPADTWLGEMFGTGIFADEDWYMIFVSSGYEKVRIDFYAEGDLNIELLDSSLNWVAGMDNGEYIEATVPQGDTYYYISVIGEINGSWYDLAWNADISDDPYEENDSLDTAWELYPGVQLGQDAAGVQADEDWYKIYVPSGQQRVLVDLWFVNDVEGEINVDLYDSSFNGLAGTDESGHIEVTVPQGDVYYYMMVYGDNAGNWYDLVWNAEFGVPDDPYEENDSLDTAWELYPGMQLGEDAAGVQADEDWYKIYVPSGQQRVLVDLWFVNDVEGEINVDLYDSSFNWLAGTDESGHIEVTVPQGDVYYYMMVYGYNIGNWYDLVWNAESGVFDDPYEENDSLDTAWELYPGMQLGEDAAGVQADEDWYKIYVPSGQQRVLIDLWFADADVGINIDLYDSSFNGLASTDESGHIEVTVPQGDIYYYMMVYGDNAGNWYDLWWNAEFGVPDDPYEENDMPEAAYYEVPQGVALSDFSGMGVQADEDWYTINVPVGYQMVLVDLWFANAEGDIDVELLDSSFSVIGGSYGSADSEHIICTVPHDGTYYYIKVYGSGNGNQYDLLWDTGQNLPPEEHPENPLPSPLILEPESGYTFWLNDHIIDPEGSDTTFSIIWDPIGVVRSLSGGEIDFYAEPFMAGAGDIVTVEAMDADGQATIFDIWVEITESSISDDPYEENDSLETARELEPGTLMGVQADDDWYMICVASGYERILIDLTFTHSYGDIDVELVDSSGEHITGSTGTMDNEHIDYTVPQGDTCYYIRVYLANAGNPYDLWWEALSGEGTSGSGPLQNEYNPLPPEIAGNTDEEFVYYLGDHFYDPDGHPLVYDWIEILPIIDGEVIYPDHPLYSPPDMAVVSASLILEPDGLVHGFPPVYLEQYYVTFGVIDAIDGQPIDEPPSFTFTVSNSFYQGGDDSYEENDTRATAYDLSAHKETWLEEVAGQGMQADEDWYRIHADAGDTLVINLEFTNASGDIDLELTDSSGNAITASTSTDDYEYIEYDVRSAGDYYIRVYYGNRGNTYNLWWDAFGGEPTDGGSLSVTIGPFEATEAGAKWKVDGGAWQNSGDTVELSTGIHYVSFKTVSGWNKPADREILINNIQTTPLRGTYTISLLQGGSHFGAVKGDAADPVWEIYLQQASISGTDLEPGDEIAIYDGETLVGSFTLSETLTQENQNANILKAWSTLDEGQEGYTPGNFYTFKCWDASEQRESVAPDPVLSDPYGEAYIGDVFPGGEKYSFAKLSFSDNITQTLELSAGTQFVSLYVRPQDLDMESVFGDVLDDLDFVRNSDGDTLRKVGPDWNNAIGPLNNTEGYLVRMDSSAQFTIGGELVNPGTPIALNKGGSQFIAYLPTEYPPAPQDALSAFAGVLDSLRSVRDSAGTALFKIGSRWNNSIGDLVPGEGYVVRMGENDTLYYDAAPDTTRRRLPRENIGEESGHFGKKRGNPAGAIWTIFLSQAELDGADLEPDDEIAVFDGDTLVGSFTLSEVLTLENQYDNSLKAWSDLGDGSGYTPWNGYTFKCWDASEEREADVSEVILNDPHGDAHIGDAFPDDYNPYSIATLIFESDMEDDTGSSD